MKKTVLAVALSAAMVAPTISAVELKTDDQKVSYSVGTIMGKQLQQIPNLNYDAFFTAMKTAYEGKESKLTDEEIQSVMAGFQQRLMDEQKKQFEKLGADNLEKGKKYQAENAKKEGVTTTDSGLQYEVVTKGTGASPTVQDSVKVHYHGMLIDGSVFDSSVERNEPVAFPLNGVIPGWKEGVTMMKVGEKARFVIPSDLAYGPAGTGPNSPIGPNETLIFEVELLEINPGQEEAQAEAK